MPASQPRPQPNLAGEDGGARLTPRNVKAADTRERIVLAAAGAFERRGYMGVNLKEVVEDLGLTSGALYYFFKRKEDLASEIVERHFAALDALVGALPAAGDDPLDAVVALTYRVGAAFERDVVVRAGARLSVERNLINADMHPPTAEWSERVTKLVRAGQRRGTVRSDVSAKATAEVIVAYFYGAKELARIGEEAKGVKRRLDGFWALMRPALTA